MSAARRQRRPGLLDVARTALALGAVLPPLAAGLFTWIATGNRQRAINRALALWGDLGTRAAGIRLEVRGAEHLETARPAVFILNHRSGVDPILVCALLRRDVVAVAKREIRRNPLLGPAFSFAGVVFVDRASAAPDALDPALAALRAGLSIAIAPEGTRASREVLGPFRSGAFRIALASRAPIVPIVLHNAQDVLPFGALVMTPATVRVDVLPPIATRDWQAAALEAHIADVRAAFLRTLAPEAPREPCRT